MSNHTTAAAVAAGSFTMAHLQRGLDNGTFSPEVAAIIRAGMAVPASQYTIGENDRVEIQVSKFPKKGTKEGEPGSKTHYCAAVLAGTRHNLTVKDIRALSANMGRLLACSAKLVELDGEPEVKAKSDKPATAVMSF